MRGLQFDPCLLVVTQVAQQAGQARAMTESMPTNPSSAKSATRAAMTADLLRLHTRGDICVTIGRAADLVGPGVAASSLGEQVVRAASMSLSSWTTALSRRPGGL